MKKLLSMAAIFALALTFVMPAFASGHHGSKQHHTAKYAYCYNGDGHRRGNHTQHFKGDGHWYCFR